MLPRILVICGDRYHPADEVIAGLSQAGSGDFSFQETLNGLELDSGYSAVVLAKMNVVSSIDSSPWASLEFDTRLDDFVSRGNGLLIVHAGTVGYRDLPAIRSMASGSFIRHPESCEVTLEPNRDHPLTSGVPSFSVHDEHYFVDFDEGADVFLLARSEHGIQHAGWTKTHGEGKVCVLTPGHFSHVWMNPSFQVLIRRGLEWVVHG